jgi:ABC-type sugar transport system ATPase subunit
MVLQSYPLYPRMSARAEPFLALTVREEIERRVRSAADTLEIT